jgi:YHS domain-containing protein
MVQDPQCKVYVPVSRAVKKSLGGNPLYFCSEDCASKFQKGLER